MTSLMSYTFSAHRTREAKEVFSGLNKRTEDWSLIPVAETEFWGLTSSSNVGPVSRGSRARVRRPDLGAKLVGGGAELWGSGLLSGIRLTVLTTAMAMLPLSRKTSGLLCKSTPPPASSPRARQSPGWEMCVWVVLCQAEHLPSSPWNFS